MKYYGNPVEWNINHSSDVFITSETPGIKLIPGVVDMNEDFRNALEIPTNH